MNILENFENIESCLSRMSARVAEAIKNYLNMHDVDGEDLFDSMRYSAMSGGKRIRPFLTLEFCRMLGGDENAAMPFACAVELIHAYSLVHDDLPCMDDSGLRRGKPSNHKVYGEATALLAGDALLTQAFYIAAGNAAVSGSVRVDAVREMAMAAGAEGMIGGQMIDMRLEDRSIDADIDLLKKLQYKKTGEIIMLSAKLGCLAAGKTKETQEYKMAVEYARCLGLAFQIVDDILDVEGDETLLGKPIGGDVKNNKATFVSALGLEGAQAEAQRLTGEAKKALAGSGTDTATLNELAEYLAQRKK